MKLNENEPRSFLIIGGTEKAGTSSLFQYFSASDQIIPSKVKETDYFRNPVVDINGYLKNFEHRSGKYYMEASPAYLGLARKVGKKIKDTVGPENVHFVFILRDPVDRVKSSFCFHKSKYYIPKSLSFEDYIKMCLSYSSGELSLNETPFDNDWFLNVLDAGKYSKHVNYYRRLFPNVTLVDFANFKRSPKDTVKMICDLIDIDSRRYDNFNFHVTNKTTQPKFEHFHRAAMKLNSNFEKFFLKNPNLKRILVNFYFLLNKDDTSIDTQLSKETYELLKSYYTEDYVFLEKEFGSAQQS